MKKEKDPYHYTNIVGLTEELFGSYKSKRSNREDSPKWAMKAIMMPDGLCHFEDGTVIDSKQPIEDYALDKNRQRARDTCSDAMPSS